MKNFLLLTILCVSAVALTNKNILQNSLNGLFQQNKLPNPKTVIPCLDDDTAKRTVAFIGTLLDKAAKGSFFDLLALKDLI
jgi:hypothetical protein